MSLIFFKNNLRKSNLLCTKQVLFSKIELRNLEMKSNLKESIIENLGLMDVDIPSGLFVCSGPKILNNNAHLPYINFLSI